MPKIARGDPNGFVHLRRLDAQHVSPALGWHVGQDQVCSWVPNHGLGPVTVLLDGQRQGTVLQAQGPTGDRVHAVERAVKVPDVRARIEASGSLINTLGPDEFAAQLKRLVEVAGRLVKRAGIKPGAALDQ